MSTPETGPRTSTEPAIAVSRGRARTDQTPIPLVNGPPMAPSTAVQGFTCGGCDARWNGFNRCHCAGCHRTFAGIGLFDQHRREVRGAGTCVDPETVTLRDTGERVMFETDGLWQSVENPTVRVPPRAAAS